MKKKAFSLIELFIVITIIGLLATVFTVGYGGILRRSRDSQRRKDLSEMKNMVESFKFVNNNYPNTASLEFGDCSTRLAYTRGWASSQGLTYQIGKYYIPGIVPEFSQNLSIDPRYTSPNASTNQCYLYRGNGADYKILAWNTVERAIAAGDLMADPQGRIQTFAIWSDNASSW